MQYLSDFMDLKQYFEKVLVEVSDPDYVSMVKFLYCFYNKENDVWPSDLAYNDN